MYKYLLDNAGDINWMAVLPLIFFVVFFTVVVVFTMLRDKGHIQRMAELPIDEDE